MQIDVIDSHTGGEPTRVVIGGWSMPEGDSIAEMRAYIDTHQSHFRNGVIREPRGSDVHVGALLVPAIDPSCCTGLIFFTTVGTLGMCGHGTIGVVETLRHLSRIDFGHHRIETPVGIIDVDLHLDGSAILANVPARFHSEACVKTKDHGVVCGDVAWGGNWFFLVSSAESAPDVTFAKRDELARFTKDVRWSLRDAGVTGDDGAEIDHVEVFGPPTVKGADSKNYVLCPGLDYDRSPCGTGTSAKLATMIHHGKLNPGEPWVQESITGTIFRCFVSMDEDKIIPNISGRAHIMAKSTLYFDDNDPFQWGIS